MAVIHLAVVCQKDNRILFGLRGFKSSYYNNTWAVTIDEESDPREDKDFFDTGVRALHQELGIENAQRNWITLNAIARECDYRNSNINMGILGVARVPYTADEVIRNKWPTAPDKDELIGLDDRPFTKDSFNDLGVVIASDAYKPISPFSKISKFHPISRLALLLATFQEFGYDFVVDKLRKMSH
jgi:isopentenyldiphosphate isomerase